MNRLGWSGVAAAWAMIVFSGAALAQEDSPKSAITAQVLNNLIVNDQLPRVRLPQLGVDPLPAPPPGAQAADKRNGQSDGQAAENGKGGQSRALPPVPKGLVDNLLRKGQAKGRAFLIPKGLLKDKQPGKPEGVGKSKGKGKS